MTHAVAGILLLSFFMLSLGCLLIGIACVKDAFTPSIVRRVEAGSVAVEETTRGIKAPASIGRI